MLHRGSRRSHRVSQRIHLYPVPYLARLVEKYLKKGSLVLVEGKIRYRHYEEEGGGRRYVTEIVGDRLIMLDKPVGANQPEADDPDVGEALPF